MNCCKGCEKRWVDVESGRTCHGNCQDYAEFLAQNEELKHKKHMDRDLSHFYLTNRERTNKIQSLRDFSRRRLNGAKRGKR